MRFKPNELIQRIRQMGIITPENEQEARKAVLMSLLSPMEIIRLQEALGRDKVQTRDRFKSEPYKNSSDAEKAVTLAEYDFILTGLGLKEP